MKADLVVVVADGGIEQAMRGILSRHKSIGIRELKNVEFPKLHKMDQGVFAGGHEIADLYQETHSHALVVLDFAWEGRPTNNVGEMQNQVEMNLQKSWKMNGRCIVIDPELEVWLWSDSPHVAAELGWSSVEELREWLRDEELWPEDQIKPPDPKLAYERAIAKKKVSKSNAIFNTLARQVSFRRCTDAAFVALLDVLRTWFPIQTSSNELPL